MPDGDRSERDVIVPGLWTGFYEATRIPAAVRVGDTLHVTGHTGETPDGSFPHDAQAQVRQTFRNVGQTLAKAGASWSDVVEINSYHIGLRQQVDDLLTVAAQFLDGPYPAWTAVGVSELFDEDALVEISCVAVRPKASP